MAFDPVTTMNLILALAVLVVGVVVYAKKKMALAVYVAVGFALFAVSHALTLAGYGSSVALIPIRALGYIVVIIGLCLAFLRRH